MILNAGQIPTVGALIAALLEFAPETLCGVAVLDVQGVVAEMEGRPVGGVDCSLDADGRVTSVWLTTGLPDVAQPPGGEWQCPSCGSRRYVRNGDEIPWCCT